MERLHHNRGMLNIANVLKDEISRISRKELRTETAALKKASAAHRSDIAALKRRVESLERSLRKVGKLVPSIVTTQAEALGPDNEGFRFSAKGLASHRARLQLTLGEAGALLDVSPQSVRNWEEGNMPRPDKLAAIAALRKMGRREAVARLEKLAVERRK